MQALLNLVSQTTAFGDLTANSNPSMRYVDWSKSQMGLAVSNPRSEGIAVQPNSTVTYFNGIRTTSIDGTTAFSLAVSLTDPSRYRFSATGGTAPGLRTDRNLALTGDTVAIVVNANQTITYTVTGGTNPLAAVQINDVVYIGDTSQGDNFQSPHNILNTGFWQVLGTDNSHVLTLTRLPGQSFSAYAETGISITANNQVLAFTATGVQIGDKVDVSAGFSTAVQRNWTVANVTSTWFEVVSTTPLAAQSGITPGASGLVFYTQGKRFVRIEADQDCAIQCNGDTSQTQRISPWVAGDAANAGSYTKVGPCWSLAIVNRSAAVLNLTIITCE